MDINTVRQGIVDIVLVAGRIDSYSAPKFLQQVTMITADHRYNIIIDLDNVSYISSAGFRVLIDIQKTCKRNPPGEVVLVKVPSRIYETLDIAGFTTIFNMFSDTSTALKHFSG
jgi:anti-sigma B factor antagonist